MGHADTNPLVSMKIRRDRPPKKPELTDDEILEIQTASNEEPEWMQVSFAIGLHTGCRLRETRIPLSCVDFRQCKITFPSPKGGEDRAFPIPLCLGHAHPALAIHSDGHILNRSRCDGRNLIGIARSCHSSHNYDSYENFIQRCYA